MIQFRFIYVSKGLVQPPTIAAQLGDGCHDSIPSAVRLLDFFERLARRHAGTAAAQASRRGAEGGNISNPWGRWPMPLGDFAQGS